MVPNLSGKFKWSSAHGRDPASPRAWEFRIKHLSALLWNPAQWLVVRSLGTPRPPRLPGVAAQQLSQPWAALHGWEQGSVPVPCPVLWGAICARAFPLMSKQGSAGGGRAGARTRRAGAAGLRGAGLRPRGNLRRRVRCAPQPAAAMPILVKAAASGELVRAAPPGDPPRARRADAPRRSRRRKLGARSPRPPPGRPR